MKQKHTQNRLKEIRKNIQLTQKQVAGLLGLQCEDRLSHWERGQSIPTTLNLLKLANIYQMQPQDFYEIIDQRSQPRI